MEVAKKLFLFWFASVLVIHFAVAQAGSIPLPSGDWLNLVFISLVTSTFILALLYMVGSGLGDDSLKVRTREELKQVIMTGVLVSLVFMFVQYLDANSSLITTEILGLGGGTVSTCVASCPGLGATGSTLMGQAKAYSCCALQTAKGDAGAIRTAINSVSRKGSKSGYCTFLGVGYYIPTCSGFNAVRGGLGFGLQAAVLAVWDLEGQYGLLLLAEKVAFAFLLPAGVFLRSFHFTRKFGGVLMAIAVGFYCVLPAVILFDEALKVSFGTAVSGLVSPAICPAGNAINMPAPGGCDPYTWDQRWTQLGYMENVSSPCVIIPLMNGVLVNAVLLTLFNLMVMLMAMKGISEIFGGELEVYWLARLS